MSRIDRNLPSQRAQQGGTVVERQTPRAKPPSAVLAPHLGAYVAQRRLPWADLNGFIRRISEVPKHRCDYRLSSLQHAAAAAETLPQMAELEQALARITAAGEGCATRAEIARITAAMVGGIPTFDLERAAGYLDGLLFALELEASVEPFSAEALAAGAYESMTRARFAPPAAEVIEAIRAQQKALSSRKWVLERVVANLPKLEAALSDEQEPAGHA